MRQLWLVLAALPVVLGGGPADSLVRAQEDAGLVPPQRTGLFLSDARACPGFTLIAPLSSKDTYLIDLQGRVVHSWWSEWQPALGAYLLPNGNLLRCGAMPPGQQPFGGPGAAARIQEFSWAGELVWDYQFALERLLPHHDIAPLPNGNVLVVAWDMKTADEAVAAGRRPELIDHERLISDCVLEIKPTGRTTGEVVWKWHAFDHLIQDHDAKKANFGQVAEHPELIDVNLHEGQFGYLPFRPNGYAKLQKLGIVAGPFGGPGNGPPRRTDYSVDWTHVNSVAYHPEFDQIILSVRAFSEVWVIDHSTTTAEAAGHSGGRYGKGGDLLYRWGNPATYRAGNKFDQRLFKQHDAHWIAPGLPGAGHILLFNNGNNRPDGPYSTADEIALPDGGDGRYQFSRSLPLLPAQAEWSYAAPNKSELFSMVVSGAQRLPNGNTLICAGASGTLIEVTPQRDQVWKYVNPVKGSLLGGGPARGRPPEMGRGGVPPINNAVFRVRRYDAEYPGLRGKVLQPGKLLEEVASEPLPSAPARQN